ncbi:MAG: helix-turn-helix domain-containing protein [Planctomycetota bacterium]
MTLGKRLLVYSQSDPTSHNLTKLTAEWGCMVSACTSLDELRGRLEGAEYDFVLVESSANLQQLMGESDLDQKLQMPLAEVEKRHIMRVLSSTGGNKTRAARVLGIDTKTLYNKLKAYKSSEELARKRSGAGAPGSGPSGYPSREAPGGGGGHPLGSQAAGSMAI